MAHDTTPTDPDNIRLDLSRTSRTGIPEVVFGLGKSRDQLLAAVAGLSDSGQGVLATRVDQEVGAELAGLYPDGDWSDVARVFSQPGAESPPRSGRVFVAAAGTSDSPVAEEAALTAEFFGAEVLRAYDVGVAGLHRIVGEREAMEASDVVIVVAGMEGALPSVVGGMVSSCVIAVPTSVGYGASFEGLAALLGMLNSCAPGVVVTNIDNGFGAAVAAVRISRLAQR